MIFCVPMAVRNRVVLFLLNNLFWLLLSTKTCYGVESDINCLRTLKNELKDPYDYLSSWVFNNRTQGFICKFKGIECWHPDEDKVLNMRLSNMALEGQFPLCLKNCTSITGLDLSDNNLTGPLPENIDHIIPYVVTLDLSSNHFSGNLTSPNLGNLTYLNVLNLQHNQFSGQIPWQIAQLARLITFNVADNSLSGPIPFFLNNKTFPTETFANNDGLCGNPLPKCGGPAKNSHAGVIIGAGVDGIILAIIVTIVVLFFAFRRSPKDEKEEDDGGNKCAKGTKGTKGITVSMFEKLVPKMRLFNLIKATNNFSENNIIGLWRTGTMYKAILPDGSRLAVKRLQESHHSDEHFISEITALAMIRHCNLVPLLGYCIARRERLLIYKYMPKGTLYDQLHQVTYQPEVMDWAIRLRIGIGVARGLMWLHHRCNPYIIHCNINSKCILLDEDCVPKISDFGLSTLVNHPEDSHLTNPLDENFYCYAYIAPEHRRKFVATAKGDVYNFGMVLLELFSGKTPDQVATAVQNIEDNTAEWITYVHNMYAKDESLIGRWCDGEIVTVLKVAFACVAPAPENRPTMLEVYQLLREIGARYGFAGEDERIAPSDDINSTSIPLNGLLVAQEIEEIH